MNAPRSRPAANGSVVWVTRSLPGAAATSMALSAIGLSPLVAPVLAVAPVEARLDLADDEDLILTSRAGAERAAALSSRRDCRVFAVGDATAETARTLGYKEVISAGADGAALLALLLRTDRSRALVHASGRDVAQDVVAALRTQDRRARRVIVYETRPCERLPEEVRTAIEGAALAAILTHSPRGASVAAALIGPLHWRPGAVAGLSEACVGPFRDFDGLTVVAAATPTEAALTQALLAALGASRDG